MKVLALDGGYGDNKIVYGEFGSIKNMFKFITAAAEVKLNDMVTDRRVITYRDHSFYVGKDALNVQSSSIIDVKGYEQLEFFAPIFLASALQQLQVVPDVIVLGLSIAQIQNSGHFRANIEDFMRKSGCAAKIVIVPQGAVAKLAIDTYGMSFPSNTKEFSPESSYILGDMGFNTLDLCHVINGVASSNMIRGIEGRGATLIVQDVVVDIKEKHGITLNLSEGKSVLDTGILKRRGVSYEVKDIIEKARGVYIENLKTIIENEFGEILDKVDNLFIVGGGAYILDPNSTGNGFVRAPSASAEYYNAIGMFLHGNRVGK
ncbi:ParM/StbA family protein [Ralstonia phage RP13]|nr:ParM/StbA family protein [Ralstonia phage RP13]